jgi:hypothetical protein
MEDVIYYETLTGAHGEDVIKEVSVAGKNVLDTFLFLPPYSMVKRSSESSGLSWDDGNISFSSLPQILMEATSIFAHLYAKGTDKCTFLTAMLGRPVQNLDSFGCPYRASFRMTTGCSLPCHKFPDKSCATRNAQNLFGWLMHHIQVKNM